MLHGDSSYSGGLLFLEGDEWGITRSDEAQGLGRKVAAADQKLEALSYKAHDLFP